MATVEEYLRMTSKPNCDYIDGVIRRKPWPTWSHARCQGCVASLLHTVSPNFEACIELTCKIREGMYLVPDVAVMRRDRIQDPYPTEPVHLCAEILSPEDKFSEILKKCEDYHAWGVETTWIVDPDARRAWEFRKGQLPAEVPQDGSLTADGISIVLTDLFSAL
jgi:Uma2 family endonuclease